MILGIALVLVGIALAAYGLHASDEREGALSLALSLLTPLGIALAMVGAIITFVPTFFDPIPHTVVMP